MKILLQKLKHFSFVLATTLYCLTPVYAEDIEIYKSEHLGVAQVNPNVLFILDTSSGMADPVPSPVLAGFPLTGWRHSDLTDTATTDYAAADYGILGYEEDGITPIYYTPGRDYSDTAHADGGSGCTLFDPSKIYYMPNNGSLADLTCSTTYANSSFAHAQYKCSTGRKALFESGLHSDNYVQWFGNPKNVWAAPSSTKATNIIECKADRGVHGLDAASADGTFLIDGANGPYSTGETWPNASSVQMTFYSANYLNYLLYARTTSGTNTEAKIDMLRRVITTIMTGVNDLNIGLMRFNSNSAGGVVKHPVLDVDATRNDMFATMKTWIPAGGSPISEALYEAYLYFAGKAPYFSATSGGESNEGSQTMQDKVVDPNTGVAVNTTIYDSPVDLDLIECQRQFVIILSDGTPHEDIGMFDGTVNTYNPAPAILEPNREIEQLLGVTECAGKGYEGFPSTMTATGQSGRCLDDLAAYLHDTGFSAYLGSDVGTANDITLTTYTIGFGDPATEDFSLLQTTAEVGGGQYTSAQTPENLLEVILAILNDIKGIHTTFSSPAVSVNAFNRTTHRSDLYFTLFKPSIRPHWDGNFKRFKLSFNGDVPVIVDINNDPAVSATTGFFEQTSRSWWTPDADAPDGEDSASGGMASKLTSTRNLYTNLDATFPVNLSTASNEFIDTNAGITNALLGLPDITDPVGLREQVIQWGMGFSVNGVFRRKMGDPLHGQPALVQYGGTIDNPEITAYVVTNDGFLHAVNTATGDEEFAFIPKSLLPNLHTLYSGTTSGAKVYGLDGTVIPEVNDVNSDGIINPADGDYVYIYFGMRRGGNKYYALDVTDKASPKLKWVIDGSAGDFVELGQSWSTPVIRKIRYQGADKTVMIVGAGYDVNQDAVTVRTADSIGRGIFVIDAHSGAMLFRIGPDIGAHLQLADMLYSIPSDVSPVDSNGDGYVDHLYVGDMGGQLWRVDIDNIRGDDPAQTLSNIITAGRIADLAGTTEATNRRFYYPPDAAIMKMSNGTSVLALVVSSGYRAHPTYKTTQDKMYMIRDTPVHGAPVSYVTLTENNLYDTTSNIIGQGTDAEVSTAGNSLSSANGWMIDYNMSIGEKGLSKALIFNNEIFATTYVPNDPNAVADNLCTPREGSGFLYHISLFDGTPKKNYDTTVVDDIDNLTVEDRKVQLTRSGIPADPTAIMTQDGSAICVGPQCQTPPDITKHNETYWYEK
ncbi:MAG: PilC/PilY family type IV pilus protein [Gammaproteobacteria bacterium]|nr:PilC/PilY family type IV pilus protein [Gammaproteobacteria bacterium]